jgi:uncharacterized membrane protein
VADSDWVQVYELNNFMSVLVMSLFAELESMYMYANRRSISLVVLVVAGVSLRVDCIALDPRIIPTNMKGVNESVTRRRRLSYG